MSQFNAPPPPPGSVPPNFGQPPEGFPPPGYGQMPPTRTSIAAVISLISGILGCLVIPAIIAIITGIMGIAATSNPNVKGRGLAITGLILGLLFGLIGGGIGLTSWWGIGKVKEMAGAAVQPFIASVVEGDIAAAASQTSMTEAEIAALRAKIADWGKITNVSMSLNGMNAQNNNGRTTIDMRGTATFDKAGDKPFRVLLDDAGGNKLKVTSLTFD